MKMKFCFVSNTVTVKDNDNVIDNGWNEKKKIEKKLGWIFYKNFYGMLHIQFLGMILFILFTIHMYTDIY